MSAPQPGPGVEGLPPRPGGGGNGGGGASGIEFTDGVNTVNGATKLTVAGGVVGGTTPNATLTVTPNGSVFLNPFDANADFSFTDNSLTATVGGALSDTWVSLRANKQVPSGKYYFEFTIQACPGSPASGGEIVVGLANSSFALSGNVKPQSDANAIGFDANGYVSYNGSEVFRVSPNPVYVTGGVCAVAIDTVAEKLWFYNPVSETWNTANLAGSNPSTGVGGIDLSSGGLNFAGPYFPVLAVENGGAVDQVSINGGFMRSQVVNPGGGYTFPPTGFSFMGS